MGFNVICAAFEKKNPKTVCHTIFINDKFLVIQFPFLAKMIVIQFPFMGNCLFQRFHTIFVWNCLELYDKNSLIYENFMIRVFGQPG